MRPLPLLCVRCALSWVALDALRTTFTADARALQHWIYDMDKMGKLVAEGPTEFHTPEGPFYRRDVGLHTGYGDLVCGAALRSSLGTPRHTSQGQLLSSECDIAQGPGSDRRCLDPREVCYSSAAGLWPWV